MIPPVHTLTLDQAVDELAAIFDSRPDDDQVIALRRWKDEYSQRAVDLEAWILMKTPKEKAQQPEPAAETEDAPPQHLQKPPKVAAKRKPPITKKTPAEKLKAYVADYARAVEKVAADPSNRPLRYAASTVRSHIKTLCSQFRLNMPELAPLPTLPDPKPKGGAAQHPKAVKPEEPGPAPTVDQVLDEHVKEIHIHPEKVGPGPYEPPTAAQIQAHLPSNSGARVREIAAGLAKAIDDSERNIDRPRRLRMELRGLRHDLIPVLIKLELLTPAQRAECREDFQGLLNLVLTAEILMSEPDISQAG